MDTTYTLKIRPQRKQGHVMSRIKCLNHQWSSGTSKHNLVELGSTSTTLPTYQPSCSTTEDEHPTHVNSHLEITCTHLLCNILYLVTLIDVAVLKESKESVLFQPVLKVYTTHHSWIITAHVSLGNLEKQWRMFVKQMGRLQQLLNSLQQKPLAPTYMISALQAELTNLVSIYTSHKPLILIATQLLRREPTFNGVSPFNRYTRKSLLPFLGDALSGSWEQ